MLLGVTVGKLTDVEKNDMSAWLPKNAEATKAISEAAKFQPADTMPAIVIYNRDSGLTEADQAKAKADAAAFKGVAGVAGEVDGPLASKDNKALQTVVQVQLGAEGWTGAAKTVDGMVAIAEKDANGLGTHVTGPAGYAADSGKIFSSMGLLGAITFLVVLVILLFTYRSPTLLFIPLITAGVAVKVAEGVVYLLAKHAGLTVNGQSSFILTVLVVGAATDYALLLIARYREELRKHNDVHVAMAEALHKAGEAIIASAATVAISLMILMLATLNSTKGLGPVCAIGIVVGLAAMITLMPALLVIFGRWIFWPRIPHEGTADDSHEGLWGKVGQKVAIRPRIVWIVTAIALAGMSFGLVGLKADGISQKNQFTKTTQAVTGEEIQSQHFPSGSGDPIYVIANAGKAAEIKAALAATPGVSEVSPQQPVKDGRVFTLATLADAPNSKAAMDSVRRVGDAVHAVPDADAKLSGGTAITVAMEDAASHDSKVIIPVTLVVVFLILALLLRAIVAPLLLMLTVVLSFAAALGVSNLVFLHVFKFEGMDASFPLMAFTFLVALGIDYNIFLVTRIREEALQHGTRKGALIGLSATGGVITSAGLVLAGTFAALGAMPMVFLAELGFVVAFGVLLDTIIVRSVLVTALTLDVGRYFWWPSALFHKKDDAAVAAPDESGSLVKS
ncbi:MMPL family transporter [Actinocorallia lasiicapitis]